MPDVYQNYNYGMVMFLIEATLYLRYVLGLKPTQFGSEIRRLIRVGKGKEVEQW